MNDRLELARAAADLIMFWSQIGEDCVHPLDDLKACPGLATDLTPKPWMGNLKGADVYLLYLNPGRSDSDVEWEADNRFRERARANLSTPRDYFYLDPKFAGHPGADWAKETFGSDACSLPRSRICILQLVAYHSTNGRPAERAAKRLTSSERMRSLSKRLVALAQRGEIAVIVARSQNLWGFSGISSHSSLLIYTGGHCRRAYMTKNTAGGRFLRRELGLL